jgi:hypothetical protein
MFIIFVLGGMERSKSPVIPVISVIPSLINGSHHKSESSRVHCQIEDNRNNRGFGSGMEGSRNVPTVSWNVY